MTSENSKDWAKYLERLEELVPFAENANFRRELRAVKLDNKRKLAEIIKSQNGVDVDPTAMFDIQVKRIHEYKRQLMCTIDIFRKI